MGADGPLAFVASSGPMTSTRVAPDVARTTATLVRRLQVFDPERIILFGSHARGDAHPDSDLDVLVVVSDSRPLSADLAVEMRLAVGPLDHDYDLFVTSVSGLTEGSELVGRVEYPAVREGVTLYERGR